MVGSINRFATARTWLVKVAGIDGNFPRKTGGDVTAEASKVYDGGSVNPFVMAGPKEVGNITVGRQYDHARDFELLKKLRAGVNNYVTSVSVTPTNADLVAIGSPTTYPEALLVGFREFEVDHSSGEPSSYELEFAVPRVV